MKLAVGSDERTHLTEMVIAWLREHGHTLTLIGPLAEDLMPWPEVAHCVAQAVIRGDVEEGIVFCWTGTGVSIVANKVPGIRAALCDDPETAMGARKWNDANVLCLSLRRISEARGKEILEAWFSVNYQPTPDDELCLASLQAIERQYRVENAQE